MLQRLLLTIISCLTLTFVLFGTVSAATNPFQSVCSETSAKNSTVCTTNKAGDNPLVGPTGLITDITKVVGFLAGIGAIIVILIAGFMYITSSGDPAKVNTAKNAVLYALIGLVVIVLAQTIIIFVVGRL